MSADLPWTDQQLRQALDGSGVGFWSWNRLTGAIEWSEELNQLMGYAPGELTPSSEAWFSHLHPDEVDRVAQTMYAVLHDQRPSYHDEHRFRRQDGRWIWIRAYGRVIERDDQGVPSKLIGTVVDVTSDRQQHAELDAALRAAETASRAKATFLAGMSHEIRTPITAVLGYADLLSEAALSPEQHTEWLEKLRHNASYLLALVNGLLDMSKLEGDQSTALDISDRALRPLVDRVVAVIEPIAQAKQLTFDVDYATPLPPQIRTDPLRFEQVLINLSTNAVAYTPQGSVTLRLSWEPTPEVLVVEVVDTGIGIPPEDRERIFEAFYRGPSDPSAPRPPGAGLGLAITRELCHHLAITLELDSEVGRGSVFRLRVPQPDAPTPLDFADPRNSSSQLRLLGVHRAWLKGRLLLVVDDSPDLREVFTAYLEAAAAEVRQAPDGRQAVDAVVAASHAGRPFDAVLMDMSMPVLDGYGAVRELRERGVATPIIALTAYATPGDAQATLTAGCDAYLSKPVDRHQLLETILELLGSPHTPPPLESHSDTFQALLEQTRRDFRKGAPARRDALHQATRDKDLEALENVVHKLRGTAGTLGFQTLSEASKGCLDALRSDVEWPTLEPWLATVTRALDDLIDGKD